VCWEAKELADGTFRVRNLEWILTKRPQNQLITEAFTLTDVVSPDEPMVVGANSTWSVTDIHNTSGGETDVMVIVDRAGNSTLQVRSGAINSYLAGHPLPEGVTDTDRSIHWTLGEIQMPMHSFRIDKEGDLLVFLEHGHFINYRVNAADGSETIVRTGFDATPAILSRYRVQFPEE